MTDSTKSTLPPASKRSRSSSLTIHKGLLNSRRMYAGHFQGSIAPSFQLGTLYSVRDKSVMQELEELRSREGIKKKKMEAMEKQIKFDRSLAGKQHDFRYEVPAMMNSRTGQRLKTKTYLGNIVSNVEEKIDSGSMVDVVFEIDIESGKAAVYPASLVEFQLKSRLESDMTEEEENKLLRAEAKRKRKGVKRNTEFEQLNSLFGVDEASLSKKQRAEQLAKRKEEAKTLSSLAKSCAVFNMSEAEVTLLTDELAGDKSKQRQTSPSPGLDSTFDSLYKSAHKADSKRIKALKTKAETDEMNEYAEIAGHFDNDEEIFENINDHMGIEDNEEFELADDDEGGIHSDSEDDEAFIKLKGDLADSDSILSRDYKILDPNANSNQSGADGNSDGTSSGSAGGANGLYSMGDLDEDENAWMKISDDEGSDEEVEDMARVSASSHASSNSASAASHGGTASGVAVAGSGASSRTVQKRNLGDMSATDASGASSHSNPMLPATRRARIAAGAGAAPSGLPTADEVSRVIERVLTGKPNGLPLQELWMLTLREFTNLSSVQFKPIFAGALKKGKLSRMSNKNLVLKK